MECCTNRQAVLEAVVCKIERQVAEVEMVLADVHNALFLQQCPDLKSLDEHPKVLEMRLGAISGKLDNMNTTLGTMLSAVRNQLGSLKLVG
jgi:hypothetical protein